jgi:hypothetical protein
MVIVEEIKNSETVYESFGDIMFCNSNTAVAINYVNSFHEDDLEVTIETHFPAEGLERGWVGDMYYEAVRGINVATNEKVNSKYNKRIKDVLLARVNTYKDGPECVTFTYTFLKY